MSREYSQGCEIEEIRQSEQFLFDNLEAVVHSGKQTVLHHLELKTTSETVLNPREGVMRWDSDHVRLPCADQNKSTVRPIVLH